MLDAMQLCLFCHCTHAGCYATVFSCQCTHAGCYATVFVLPLHTRRDNHRLEEYVWSFLFRTNARQNLLEALGKLAHEQTMPEDGEKTTSFFRRMVPIRTNSKQNAFVKTRTHGKMGRNEHMNQQTINGNQHPCSISYIFNKMTCEYRPGSQSRP